MTRMTETPTLFVCHGDEGGPRIHPCRRAQEALHAAGVEYEKGVAGPAEKGTASRRRRAPRTLALAGMRAPKRRSAACLLRTRRGRRVGPHRAAAVACKREHPSGPSLRTSEGERYGGVANEAGQS